MAARVTPDPSSRGRFRVGGWGVDETLAGGDYFTRPACAQRPIRRRLEARTPRGTTVGPRGRGAG